MFRHNILKEGEFELHEITDGEGTAVTFMPARGGILVQCTFKGVPVFYLDQNTLLDAEKNIRGGNPVLFPICGPLEKGKYKLDGKEYEMKQHGLARNESWELTEIECSDKSAAVTMTLSANQNTRSAYPFNFHLCFKYVIEENMISVNQEYHNLSDDEMPFYAGFHPYFYAPGKKAVSLSIPSERYYNIKSDTTEHYLGTLDLNQKPETNLIFSQLTQNEASFTRGDGYRVTCGFDEKFRYVVIWALEDKEFLCIEPWMGTNYDMNRGNYRVLGPGEKLKAVIWYSLTKL